MFELSKIVDYDHTRNLHTLPGARTALELLFDGSVPNSMLDVGCGRGTWLRAALELGVSRVYGVDGVAIGVKDLLFPKNRLSIRNLAESWDLGEHFDVALCLEVAEHLPVASAETLIGSLIKHARLIFFSAAAPGQIGQHHINCQWPQHWQGIFNRFGFVCEDWPRWKLWDREEIEPWYRQNMFCAWYDPALAGRELAIRSVVHPAMLASQSFEVMAPHQIEAGLQSITWYLSLLPKAGIAKLKRKLVRPGSPA